MPFDWQSKGASFGAVFKQFALEMAEIQANPPSGEVNSSLDNGDSQGSSFVPSSVIEMKMDDSEMVSSDSDSDGESDGTETEVLEVRAEERSEHRLKKSLCGSKCGVPMLKRSAGVDGREETLVVGAWEEKVSRSLLKLCELKSSLTDKQRNFFEVSKEGFSKVCVMVVASVVEELGEVIQPCEVVVVDPDLNLEVKKCIDVAWSNLRKHDVESFGNFSRVHAPRILFGLVCEFYMLRFGSALCVDSSLKDTEVVDDGLDIDDGVVNVSDEKVLSMPRVSSLSSLVPRVCAPNPSVPALPLQLPAVVSCARKSRLFIRRKNLFSFPKKPVCLVRLMYSHYRL